LAYEVLVGVVDVSVGVVTVVELEVVDIKFAMVDEVVEDVVLMRAVEVVDVRVSEEDVGGGGSPIEVDADVVVDIERRKLKMSGNWSWMCVYLSLTFRTTTTMTTSERRWWRCQ
jgi:hypothetical protein